MKLISRVLLVLACFGFGQVHAQLGPPPGGGGPRPENLGASPAELGSPGIVWYPILKDGLAEAKRTNKPILFMAVASQCGGVPGVF